MYAFTLERPGSLDEAVKQLAGGARPLAGGQTLLASMKLRLADPEHIVDLGAVPGLADIRRQGDTLHIGAMARHADVAASPDVQHAIPALAQLAGNIGDRQVRAMGTLGGSVANNDPAACYPSAVLALDATVITNQREIAADDFFQGMFSTALHDNELITAIRFPVAQRAAYMKFRQPASRFALVGVFVAETSSGVRVAITGAGNGVFRHAALEDALNNQFAPDAIDSVHIDPDDFSTDLHASAAYRANLAKVLTRRAVARCLGQN
ncbi:MAG: xanthine dehydrogenase family protein subunit M [Burkholderiaceae bacterium]|jgi:carbon-monoxide dehydrogenase medium subunit